MNEKVLIFGGRASSLAAKLKKSGYDCTAASRVAQLKLVKRPDAVVIAATPPGRSAVALDAIRKTQSLKKVPIFVDGSLGDTGVRPDEVDSVATSYVELERFLAASVKARQFDQQEELAQRRLEFLLNLSRSINNGDTLLQLAESASQGLNAILECEEVGVLCRDERVELGWTMIENTGRRFPVDLAIVPMLRRCVDIGVPVQGEGIEVFPLNREKEGLVAIQLKREQRFTQLERDLIIAASGLLTSAVERDGSKRVLEEIRASLEAAYVERYDELVSANARLKAIDKKTNELVAVLTHDVRAPLNVLLGHAHLLLTDDKVKDKARNSAEVIQRTSQKILRLMEEVLEKNRGQEHTVLFTQNVDITTLANEVTKELQILTRQRGIELRTEAPMCVPYRGDEQKLRQVFQNLITNARDHATDATEIVVRVGLKRRPNGEVVHVEVQDDGKVENPSALLLAFERAQGLGLSICREYVERHGGEIWAEAPKEGGALFAFDLPMMSERAPQATNHEAAQSRRPRVLICQDDPVSTRAATLGLSSHFEVETVRDGELALERARTSHPDLMVVDVFLQKKDGLETLRELRIDPQTAEIPVILVSSSSEIGEKIQRMNLGVVGHLQKPIEPAVLLERVVEALQRVGGATSMRIPGNDVQTGLFDHFGLVRRLAQELSRAGRYGRPLSVAVLKPKIAVETTSIPKFAQLIRRELRAPDVVGHIGNGSFAILLPETPNEHATGLARRLGALGGTIGLSYDFTVTDVGKTGLDAERALERLLM